MDEDVDILMSMYQLLSREDIDAALKENGLTPTGVESSSHIVVITVKIPEELPKDSCMQIGARRLAD